MKYVVTFLVFLYSQGVWATAWDLRNLKEISGKKNSPVYMAVYKRMDGSSCVVAPDTYQKSSESSNFIKLLNAEVSFCSFSEEQDIRQGILENATASSAFGFMVKQDGSYFPVQAEIIPVHELEPAAAGEVFAIGGILLSVLPPGAVVRRCCI